MTDGRGRRLPIRRDRHHDLEPWSESFKRYEKPLGFGQKTLGDIKQIRTEVMKAAETRFTPEFRTVSTRSSYFAADDGRGA
jgi:hypothetical protein